VTHNLVRSLLPHFAVGKRPVSSAIYGTVSVVAVIVVAAHQRATAGVVLLFAIVAMVVIWAVHVYASALAAAGVTGLHWRTAVPRALHEELGVLEGAAAPLAVLVVGAVGLLDDEQAIRWAVWCGVVLLTLIPLVWLRRRGSTWRSAVLASTVAGFFGLVLVVLKVVVH
jgi:hypothetical protein